MSDKTSITEKVNKELNKICQENNIKLIPALSITPQGIVPVLNIVEVEKESGIITPKK